MPPLFSSRRADPGDVPGPVPKKHPRLAMMASSYRITHAGPFHPSSPPEIRLTVRGGTDYYAPRGDRGRRLSSEKTTPMEAQQGDSTPARPAGEPERSGLAKGAVCAMWRSRTVLRPRPYGPGDCPVPLWSNLRDPRSGLSHPHRVLRMW